MKKRGYVEMEKKRKKRLMLSTLLLSFFLFGFAGWTAAGVLPQEAVSTEQKIEEDTVLVGGMPVGIYMETDGVLVLGTQKIEGKNKRQYDPAHSLVKSGDYIVGINNRKIQKKKELIESVKHLEDENVILKLRRNEEEIDVKLKAVQCEQGEYKLGIWVRDNVQGLGTVTFLNGNSQFGALGHGIHDSDTSVLMNITGGSLYKTNIRSIIKGENGIPGSMEGLIIYNRYNRIGTIQKNTEAGLYGTVEEMDALFPEQIPVQTATKEEIKKENATIRCFLDGKVQEYDVKITEIDKNPREINKGIVLQVTDKELLERTGGIIQGMSGSPILQNGKLIGAVTHVFVNDPTKGYGIFIENMTEQLPK